MDVTVKLFVEGQTYRVVGTPDPNYTLDRVAFIHVEDPSIVPDKMPDDESDIIHELDVIAGDKTADFKFDQELLEKLDEHDGHCLLFGTFKEGEHETRNINYVSGEHGSIEIQDANE